LYFPSEQVANADTGFAYTLAEYTTPFKLLHLIMSPPARARLPRTAVPNSAKNNRKE